MRLAVLHHLAGKRMAIPSNCPHVLRDLMNICWSENPADRPEFTAILRILKKDVEQPRPQSREYQVLELEKTT